MTAPTPFLRTALACALCALALPAAAGLYKWTDANGRVVYSDQPPTNTSVKVETLNGPPPPANPNAAKELAAKEAELKGRQKEALEKGKDAEKDRMQVQRRADACTQAKGQLLQLADETMTLYYYNPKGERVAMDAAGRRAERERIETYQKENCKSGG